LYASALISGLQAGTRLKTTNEQDNGNLIGLASRQKRARLLVGLANIKHFRELWRQSVFSNTIEQSNDALSILGFSLAGNE